MPSTDEERLVVSLEARIRDFERNMQKAERTGTNSYNRLRQGSRGATQAMESDMARSTQRINQSLATTATRIGAFGKAFAGGLAVGVAVGALEGIREAAVESTKSILEMSDQAKMAGVSFKAFQGLKFVAEQNRVPIDALTDGLKELSLRADEFIQTGGGSAAESFQRLGYSAEDLAKKLKEPDQLFLEIIGRLKSLDRAAQIRISDEVFGGSGGEKFVQLIDRGEQGLRDQITAAQDLGNIMDESMVKKAEEVNQKFNLITTTIGTHVKSAIVDAVSAWFEFLDSFREFERQQSTTLQNRQTNLMAEKQETVKQINDTQSEIDALGNSGSAGMLRQTIADLKKHLDDLNAEEDRIIGILSDRTYPASSKPAFVPPTPPPGGFSSTSTSSGSGKADLTRYLAAGKDASHISGMSSSFETKLAAMLAALPKEMANAISINSGFRSNERQAQLWQQALEKYGSVAEARKWVAPPGNSQHNRGNAADLGYANDAARQWAHDNASRFGLSFPLGNENWHIEDSDARAGAIQERTKALEAQGQAYDDVVGHGRDFVAQQDLESQALGMTEEAANRLRYQQELLDRAREAGLNLTPAQVSSLKELAAQMASAEAQTQRLTQSQEAAQEAASRWNDTAKSTVKGFVSDLMHGASAADALRNALGRIADTLLNEVMDALFQVKGAGAGGTGGGGLFGGIGSLLSKIFSFDGGGFTGSGSRSGGVDGKGGFPAILHPNESVIDHTKQRTRSAPAAAGGASAVHVTSEVSVRFEEDGKFHAYVERTSATAAEKRVRHYDAHLPGRIQAINRNPRKRVNPT